MAKRAFILLTCLILVAASAKAQYSVSGNTYTYPAETGSGIHNVYVANGLGSITISYTAANGSTVRWFTYRRSLADKTEVSAALVRQENNGTSTTYSISAPTDGTAYLAEEDGALKPALWMVDYTQHLPQLQAITASASANCKDKAVALKIDKTDVVPFYGNDGREYRLRMQYKLQYDKLDWDSSTNAFIRSTVTTDWLTIGASYSVDAPLTDTRFTLVGDRIADFFGIARHISSDNYEEIFTQSHITASQTSQTADNQASAPTADNGLGGSAPAEIHFSGHANEPTANFYTWTIYNKKDPKNWVARYNDKDITYTFNNAGNYVVYLVTTNSTAACQDTASVEFSIAESLLDLPNFFTPNASPGENDEYKVVYRSLVTFKATIFNRWGNKMFEWTDPAKGWDGKYNGKFVTPGVYYVVVEAKGSDGIEYKKTSDINIFTTP